MNKSDARYISKWLVTQCKGRTAEFEAIQDEVNSKSSGLAEEPADWVCEDSSSPPALPPEPDAVSSPSRPGSRESVSEATTHGSSTGVKDPLDKGAEEEYKGPTHTGV